MTGLEERGVPGAVFTTFADACKRHKAKRGQLTRDDMARLVEGCKQAGVSPNELALELELELADYMPVDDVRRICADVNTYYNEEGLDA